MITIYIVFYNNAMCWAFETRKEAEDYIIQAVKTDTGNTYNRDNLTIKAVDYLKTV